MYFEVSGKRVFASTGGRPFDTSRPVVVFLHGSGGDHTAWNLQSRFFAFRGYSVLALDLPGHTNSEGPPLGSVEAMADWLNAVVETSDVSAISLVAHSQGCLVGLEFGARYPERLRSLSLIASGLATPVNEALLGAAKDDPEAAIAMMTGWGFGAAGHYTRGPVPGSAMIATGQRVMRGNAPEALYADLTACNNYANGLQAAPLVKARVQVIVAGKDRMAPKKATDALIAHLPDPEVAVIADSGHMVPQEAPDRCRQLLRDFIFTHNPANQG
jgi:pimeloyl-ACP methyl ester carboxylesterase